MGFNELERPSWCPDAACQCIGSFDSAMCVGALNAPEPHPEEDPNARVLYNTHQLCGFREDGQPWQINDADAYFLIGLLILVRRDVRDRDLYHPGRGDWYDLSNTWKKL